MTPEQIKKIVALYNDAGLRSGDGEDKRDEIDVCMDVAPPERLDNLSRWKAGAAYNMAHADGEQVGIEATLNALGYRLALENGLAVGVQ